MLLEGHFDEDTDICPEPSACRTLLSRPDNCHTETGQGEVTYDPRAGPTLKKPSSRTPLDDRGNVHTGHVSDEYGIEVEFPE